MASNTYFGDGSTDPWCVFVCCAIFFMCCRHALAVLPTGDRIGVEYLGRSSATVLIQGTFCFALFVCCVGTCCVYASLCVVVLAAHWCSLRLRVGTSHCQDLYGPSPLDSDGMLRVCGCFLLVSVSPCPVLSCPSWRLFVVVSLRCSCFVAWLCRSEAGSRGRSRPSARMARTIATTSTANQALNNEMKHLHSSTDMTIDRCVDG